MAAEGTALERRLSRRNARRALVAIGLLSLFFAFALRDARVDYDFEKFFPVNDPELDRYEAFRQRFGSDNDFLLVGIEREQGVFEHRFLTRVDALAAALERVPHVRSVTSPTRLAEPVVTPMGAFELPYLRFATDSLLATDSVRIWNDPRVRDAFFDPQGRALLVVLLSDPGLSKAKSDTLLSGVERAIASSGLPGVRLGGRIHGQHYYIEMMVEELFLFLAASILLLAVFLWAGFRSFWGVVTPIATVGLAILWQVGLMTLLGKPLSILTMLLPTILFVVGMSDVVHILECYLDELRAGHPRIRALARTYREVGLPTLLTAITAAIGFATLGTASIRPLQEFGLYTGLGVLLAFVLAFTLLPALLVFIGPEKLLPRRRASPWDRHLPRLFQWVVRHRRGIVIGFGLITVAGVALMTRIKVNNYLLEDWPEDDAKKVGYRFFEDRFGGVRPFEIEIVLADTARSIWDPAVLRQIERVQDHLEQGHGLHQVLSPVTLMLSLNKAFNGGDAGHYMLPTDSAESHRMARQARLLAGKEGLQALVRADGKGARLSGRMVDEGGYIDRQRNAELDRFVAANTDSTLVRFHQTGMAYLIDRNNATLSSQLVGGMGLAVLLTALIMMWFFRDPRMVVVALLPNLVPLAFVAGVMGACGIDLKVSTAIIFSIAFGIAEDDTIHMLAKLRQQLAEGRTVAYALKRTYLSTGKAVTVTSLMLVSGFITLTLSDFASVFYMGLLITLTLAFAFVTELLLLPALVMLIMRPRKARE